jgi:hypothetical protein
VIEHSAQRGNKFDESRFDFRDLDLDLDLVRNKDQRKSTTGEVS